uniref:F-box domain-containing protein n=1 Tax=Parastrongyloides trichosuri TaxID=131310 RepID=A0A0N5A7C0_PARTI
MSITLLPDEIIIKILSNLSNGDLKNVRMVDRNFNHMIEDNPDLWEKYELEKLSFTSVIVARNTCVDASNLYHIFKTHQIKVISTFVINAQLVEELFKLLNYFIKNEIVINYLDLTLKDEYVTRSVREFFTKVNYVRSLGIRSVKNDVINNKKITYYKDINSIWGKKFCLKSINESNGNYNIENGKRIGDFINHFIINNIITKRLYNKEFCNSCDCHDLSLMLLPSYKDDPYNIEGNRILGDIFLTWRTKFDGWQQMWFGAIGARRCQTCDKRILISIFKL